jgi:hypothetical protein
MKLNGLRNIKTLLLRQSDAPSVFDIGPVKFAAYLDRAAVKPELMIYINGGTYIKRLPVSLDLLEAQNHIDFRILDCDNSFDTLYIKHRNERINIKFKLQNSHSTLKGLAYRLHPSGSVTRIN